MRHFYENRNKASVALNPLVSVFYLFVARGGRNRGNRQTDRPSTATLGAHARRRGLMKSTEVQTLGELRMRATANGWAGLLAFTRGLSLVARRESDTG